VDKNRSKELTKQELGRIKDLVFCLQHQHAQKKCQGRNYSFADEESCRDFDIFKEIKEDPLGTEVIKEYRILLYVGGPAVRIRGLLDSHGQPDSAVLEYQDWDTSWEAYPVTSDEEKILLQYASVFYPGD
jgi:hypothetical protein